MLLLVKQIHSPVILVVSLAISLKYLIMISLLRYTNEKQFTLVYTSSFWTKLCFDNTRMWQLHIHYFWKFGHGNWMAISEDGGLKRGNKSRLHGKVLQYYKILI